MVLGIIGLLITVFGIVVPLIFGVWQLKKRFDWDKAMLFYELGKVWNEKTLEHRRTIEKKYGSYFVNISPVEISDPMGFVNASEGDDLYPIKIAVISLMNHFELIADLYVYGMVDKHLVDASIRKPMSRYYTKIKPFAECIDKVAGYPSWKPLDDLIEVWEKEDKEKSSVKAREFP